MSEKKIPVSSTFLNGLNRYTKTPTNRASLLSYINKFGNEEDRRLAQERSKNTSALQGMFSTIRAREKQGTNFMKEYNDWIRESLQPKKLRAGTDKSKTQQGVIEPAKEEEETSPLAPPEIKDDAGDAEQKEQVGDSVLESSPPPFDAPDPEGEKTNDGVVGLFPKIKEEHPKKGGDPVNTFYKQRIGTVRGYQYRRDKMYPFMNAVRNQQRALGIRKATEIHTHGDPSYLSSELLTPQVSEA
jgi:hypothetical protein